MAFFAKSRVHIKQTKCWSIPKLVDRHVASLSRFGCFFELPLFEDVNFEDVNESAHRLMVQNTILKQWSDLMGSKLPNIV